ncbi:MAG: galactokinase [Acidimicrobiales bacterium]
MARGTGVGEQFQERFDRRPEGLWQAPGRVNLIGEHTDYNAGLALPFAIDRRVVVAAARRDDGRLRCWSADGVREVQAERGALFPSNDWGWGAYPVGVVWAFREAGFDVGGFDLAVGSTVPVGRGLSSSAALSAAVGLAVSELSGAGVSGVSLAALCQRAESGFVGVPVGLLDPLAVLCGSAGHALLIDFAGVSTEPVPLAGGPLAVVDTGVSRSLADGAYAERRRECERAAAALGVPDLRHADLAAVEDRLVGTLRARARHVVTENGRVLEAVARLRSGQPIGELLSASHVSLRDDFDVSCPELDLAVEAVVDAGGEGARMTGAGFGGCAIASGVTADVLRGAVSRRWARQWGERPLPTVFDVVAASGGGRIG